MRKDYLAPTIRTLHLVPATVLATSGVTSTKTSMESHWDEVADEFWNSKSYFGSITED